MKKDELAEKIKEFIQKTGPMKWVVLIVSGVLLIVLSCGGLPGKNLTEEDESTEYSVDKTAGTENELQSYQDSMEQKVEKILEKVEGVDDVDVMITLRASKEKVALKDNKVDSGKSEEETVLTEDENNNTSPYVVQEVEPEIEGILVVCSQGDSPTVQREIIYGIYALFPVESHKIKVMKSKEVKE